MKKILLIVFVVFFLGNVFAGSGHSWTPSGAQGYTFPPVVQNQDFTITLYHHAYIKRPSGWYSGDTRGSETWGRYGSAETGWPIIVGTRDTNMFRAPIEPGCTVKNYVQTAHYFFDGGYRVSDHTTTMTLNCNVGDYTILGKYGIYNRLTNENEGWVFSDGGTQAFYFRVVPGITPPFYDYNLFWSIIKKDTNQFIHVWDVNETMGKNYFIKAFRVKVSPDCNIIGGGAKNLSKTQNVGTWKKTIDTPTDKKFELSIKTFQEGVDGYSGCTDTNINYGGYQDGKGEILNAKYNGINQETITYILIRFKNLSIPPGSTINSATLNLNSISSNTSKISVYHVWKYDWNETEATWIRWKSLKQWGHPGATESSPGSYEDWSPYYNTLGSEFAGGGYDIKSASLGSSIRLVNATEAWWSDVNRAINVTKSLQSQLDNNKFGGWLIRIDNWASEYSNNSSCNASDPSKRPKLTVRWTEPGSIGDSKDLNNLNLYANVKCDGWGFKDFNITIWDADDYSTDLNTVILDINAYKYPLLTTLNQGPPGVRINGPFYMGDHAVLDAEAYGVKDYTTDTNYFFTPTEWRVCPENVWKGGTGLSGCFSAGATDSNCTFVSEMDNLYGEILDEGDYNYFIGGKSVFQYVFGGGFLVCYSSIDQHRKLFFLGTSQGNTFFDIADVYGMDIKALLKNPYYVVLGEESTINGIAMDNSEWGGIESATWYSYDNFCGPKETVGEYSFWILSDQTTNFSELGENGPDANVTAKIKCDEMPPNGETAINLAIISDKEYYPGAGKVYIRGHTRAVVIIPDSLILDSFEVVPSKVRKGNLVNFTAVVKSKYDKKDLNVEVEFKIFDKETGEEIAVISQPKTIPKLGQQTFTYSFDTSDAANPKIKQNTAYRVTATAYLKSGSGPMKDKQAVNDILERYFWVLDAEDKLSQLPETNLIGILLVLISVSLILLNTRKE